MANIPAGILGEFIGKLGTKSGVIVDGKAYIKTLESNKKYTFSQAQKDNQTGFGLLSEFSKLIRYLVLEPYWIPYKTTVTRMQSFMHFNRKYVIDNQYIDFCRLELIRSNIPIIQPRFADFNPTAGVCFFDFGFGGVDSIEFKVWQPTLFIYHVNSEKTLLTIDSEVFFGTFIQFLFPPQSSTYSYYYYLFFYNTKTKKSTKAQPFNHFIFSRPCPPIT